MKNLGFVALAGVLTASCTVGPAHRRPPLDAPAQFRGAPAPAEAVPAAPETASLADRPWWEVLQDETLEGLIDEALRNSHDIRLAAARIEEARAVAGIAKSEYFPEVQAGVHASRGRQPEFTAPGVGTTDLYEVSLGVSWEVDLWGRIRRLEQAALARYLATEEARRGVLLSLVAEVATGYFRLRALDFELEIAQRTAAAFAQTHDLFEQRLDAGIASSLETASAAASLATTASTIPNLERLIADQENQLSTLLGRNPGPVPRGAALDEQVLPPDVPPGLPSNLLERRPDLRLAEQELVAANAEVGVAKASYFPTLRLTGFLGGLAPEVSELFDTGKTWSIGGGLLSPLLQGNRLKQQHRAAIARWEQAKVAYERSVTGAFAEVSTALVAYEKLADVEREQTRAVAAYREAVELANSRYLSGLADYLEVLQAQRQLFPAENGLAQTRFDRLAVLVELYRALGGGWQLPDEGWVSEADASGPAIDAWATNR